MDPRNKREEHWRKSIWAAKIGRLSVERLERVEKVAELWLKGKGLRTISKLVGKSITQVSRDLNHARALWAKTFRDNLNRLVDEAFARLDRIEAEAWRAWERSQAKSIETSTEVNEGLEGTTTKRTKKVRRPIGEAAMLAIPLKCVEARIRLFEFMTRDSAGDRDDIIVEAVEVIVQNREEAEQMLTFEQFRDMATTGKK